jgi:hypothetical protein
VVTVVTVTMMVVVVVARHCRYPSEESNSGVALRGVAGRAAAPPPLGPQDRRQPGAGLSSNGGAVTADRPLTPGLVREGVTPLVGRSMGGGWRKEGGGGWRGLGGRGCSARACVAHAAAAS